MAWKRLITVGLICALAAVLALPAAASAADFTPYDGMIHGDVFDVAECMAAKRAINQDYVFFRSGADSYLVVIGDLTYDTQITGTD